MKQEFVVKKLKLANSCLLFDVIYGMSEYRIIMIVGAPRGGSQSTFIYGDVCVSRHVCLL